MQNSEGLHDFRRLALLRNCWLLAAAAILLTGCLNHYLIHPKKVPPETVAWKEEVVQGTMKMRIRGVRPVGEGPFPGVLVHPEANHEAREMRGILRSLALEGYLAMAVDYQRVAERRFGDSLFPWREPADVRAAFDHLAAHPAVDKDRLGALGFSQGGVFSLLIAAHLGSEGPGSVKAVVAYYPVTDFERWLDDPRRTGPEKWAFRFVRRFFYRASGAETEEELSTFLARASPYPQAEKIHAPVLLVHGTEDTSADVRESRLMAERLEELGTPVELVELEGAGHVFNFEDADLAARAWRPTLDWLDRYLKTF